MSWHIYPQGGYWILRKSSRKRAHAKFDLRRDAIAAAKKEVGDADEVIYVQGPSGLVVLRIPEVQKVAAAVWIKRAGDMTPSGRKEVAAWLRQHAADLVKDGTQYASNFRGRYYYAEA